MILAVKGGYWEELGKARLEKVFAIPWFGVREEKETTATDLKMRLGGPVLWSKKRGVSSYLQLVTQRDAAVGLAGAA